MKNLMLIKGLAPYYFSTELDYIETNKEDEFILVKCDGKFRCQWNYNGEFKHCAMCQGRIDHFAKKFSNVVKVEHFKGYNISSYEFKNIEEVKNFTFMGVQLGIGAASSTISINRDTELTAISTYMNMNYFILKHNPDQVIIHNGRTAESRPIIQLCEQLNIPYITYEKKGLGRESKRIEFENATMYDIPLRTKLMRKRWDKSKKELYDIHAKNKELAKKWYSSLRYPNQSVINNQDRIHFNVNRKSELPLNFNTASKNIAIFTSSEDEMLAVPEWEGLIPQHKLIRELAEKLPDHQLWVRLHPNLSGLYNTQIIESLKLGMQFKNVHIIEPEEKIDSYHLAENCQQVLTFGSTIGIECAYWGMPTFLIGRAFYEELNVVTKCKNVDEFMNYMNYPPMIFNDDFYIYALEMIEMGNSMDLTYTDKNNTIWKKYKIKKLYLETIKYLIKYGSNLLNWNWNTSNNRRSRYLKSP
jgi:hypothetical protein